MVNAEIIAVGTELLLGQIANTNAQWISEQLATRGIGVYYHQVVGDNRNRMETVFKHASDRSELIFITGGLGPTEDDITREVIAKLVGEELVENDEALNNIKAYFKQTNRQMSSNNLKQAQIINGAKVIPNSVGTAPGMIIAYKSVHFILLPGVPSEMKSMIKETVIPYLEELYSLQEVIVSKMLRCIGIGESQLEMKVKDLIDKQTNPTIAPLASSGEVALRLTAMADSTQAANQLIEEKEREIHALIGEFIYGSDAQTINEVIINLLKERNHSIASAESLTGGLLGDAFVSVSGASKAFKGSIVSYTVDAKENVLGIDPSILKEYGTVSEETAKEMAKLARKKFDTTYSISFTGVSGPEPLENKPVGTVYICFYQSEDNYDLRKFEFRGHRDSIRERAVKKGLEIIYQNLK